jgi:hypothetical protein
MMGRIDSRLRQAKPGGEHPDRPCLGGVSCVAVGDPAQCEPIRDQQLYDVAPHRKTATDQDLAAVRLSNAGLEVYRTFEDVVILTTCHRLARIDDPRTPADHEFNERAERFVHVLRRLRDLEWTAEDYFWLCQRKVGRLSFQERARFADAPVLLDYRKSTEDNPDNNCDEYNRGYLRKTARALGVPVIRFAARHEGMSDREAAELTPDEFNGLMPELELCEGARVLLTHNLAVEHGLMNGTQGVVQQIVFAPGGGPDAERPELRMPEAVVVDFPGYAGPRFYDDARGGGGRGESERRLRRLRRGAAASGDAEASEAEASAPTDGQQPSDLGAAAASDPPGRAPPGRHADPVPADAGLGHHALEGAGDDAGPRQGAADARGVDAGRGLRGALPRAAPGPPGAGRRLPRPGDDHEAGRAGELPAAGALGAAAAREVLADDPAPHARPGVVRPRAPAGRPRCTTPPSACWRACGRRRRLADEDVVPATLRRSARGAARRQARGCVEERGCRRLGARGGGRGSGGQEDEEEEEEEEARACCSACGRACCSSRTSSRSRRPAACSTSTTCTACGASSDSGERPRR